MNSHKQIQLNLSQTAVAITKGDEYPQQLLAKTLLLITVYQPGVTCTA